MLMATLSVAGESYNVCVNCWDKVKNTHSGCRTWIHRLMDETTPGIVDSYRNEFRTNGIDSTEYRDYEAWFYELLEQCLQPQSYM